MLENGILKLPNDEFKDLTNMNPTKLELLKIENKYIIKYNSINKGYNIIRSEKIIETRNND